MIGLLFKILNRKQTGCYFLSLFPFDISKLIQQKGSVEGTICEAGFGLKSAELTLHPAENKRQRNGAREAEGLFQFARIHVEFR